jgi:hypothetical protein
MLQQKAQLVYEKSGVSPDAVGGTFLQTIIAIITSLLGQMKGCGTTPPVAAASAKNPTLFDRLMIRRHIKKHLGPGDAFATFGTPIMNGVLATGAEMSEQEMATLYGEV